MTRPKLTSIQLRNIAERLRPVDPALTDVLQNIISDLNTINNDLYPQIEQIIDSLGISTTTVPDDVTNFSYSLPGNTLRLFWDSAAYAQFYEIRYGASWDTASFVTKTLSTTVDLNPVASGSHTYLIKAISITSTYSENVTSQSITINNPSQPVITAQVIDNSVTLKWTVPTADFTVASYELYRDTTKIGDLTGTFTVVQETSNGTYTYKVRAYDIYGNVGAYGTITATVNNPPDYELEDERISTFSGTKNNCAVEGIKLLACLDLATDYEHHFTNNSWSSPQDQVTAGYDRWIQPSEVTADYTEQIDYGTLLENVIVSVQWAEEVVNGSVSIVSKIRTSDDAISWTSWTTGTVHFATSMRYAEVKLEFTGTDTDLVYVYTYTIRVDVKREVDSGIVDVYASDYGSGGTVTYFNKSFKDVKSITISQDQTIPGYAIPNFTDIPNPTFFQIIYFDNTGNVRDATVRWMARGVV